MKTKLKAKHGNKHNNDLSIYKVINQILKPLVLEEVNKVNHGLAETVEKLLVAKDKSFKPPIPLSSTPSSSNDNPPLPSIPVTDPPAAPTQPPAPIPSSIGDFPKFTQQQFIVAPTAPPAPRPPVTMAPQTPVQSPQAQQPTQQIGANGINTGNRNNNNNNDDSSGSSSTGIIVGVVVGVVVLIGAIAAYCFYNRQKQPVLPHYYQKRNSQMLTVSGF